MAWLGSASEATGLSPSITVPVWADLVLSGVWTSQTPTLDATLAGAPSTLNYNSIESEAEWRSVVNGFVAPSTGAQTLQRRDAGTPVSAISYWLAFGGVSRTDPVRTVQRPPSGGHWYRASAGTLTTNAIACEPGDLVVLLAHSYQNIAHSGPHLVQQRLGVDIASRVSVYAKIATSTSETFDVTVAGEDYVFGLMLALRPNGVPLWVTHIGQGSTPYNLTVPNAPLVLAHTYVQGGGPPVNATLGGVAHDHRVDAQDIGEGAPYRPIMHGWNAPATGSRQVAVTGSGVATGELSVGVACYGVQTGNPVKSVVRIPETFYRSPPGPSATMTPPAVSVEAGDSVLYLWNGSNGANCTITGPGFVSVQRNSWFDAHAFLLPVLEDGTVQPTFTYASGDTQNWLQCAALILRRADPSVTQVLRPNATVASRVLEADFVGGSGALSAFTPAIGTLSGHTTGNGALTLAGGNGVTMVNPNLNTGGQAVIDGAAAEFDSTMVWRYNDVAGPTPRLNFRDAGSGNRWAVFYNNGTFELVRQVGGSTNWGTDYFEALNGSNITVRVRCEGTNIRVWVNGTQRMNITDSTYQAATGMSIGMTSGGDVSATSFIRSLTVDPLTPSWTPNTGTAHSATSDESDTAYIEATTNGASVTLGLTDPSPAFDSLSGAVLTVRARRAP